MTTTLDPKTEKDRVRHYTSAKMLEEVEKQIERNVAYYGAQTHGAIEKRINDLKQEWSINRALQANVASAGLLGAVLGLSVNRKWGCVTATAFSFFLLHGLLGWDPPIPLLRRLGMRTRSEIDREIYALKVARGDFKDITVEGESRDQGTSEFNHARRKPIKLMKKVIRIILFWLSAIATFACPVCNTETGRQVREEIFGANFATNLLYTLAPFPVVIGLAGLICWSITDRIGPQKAEDNNYERW